MNEYIRIPSAELSDKYSALNRKSVDIFIKITEELKPLGIVCYLKEKDIILEGIRKNYVNYKELVTVTISDSYGKIVKKSIGGFFSKTKEELLLSEKDVFDILVKCTRPERIQSVVWNDEIVSTYAAKEVIMNNENLGGSKKVEKQSLCRVLGVDDTGTRRLKRLGDISTDGYIQSFTIDEYAPKFFENRITIYWKDGPTDEGYVGVWDWSSIPNKSGSDSDYVESKYNSNLIPTEIIEVPKAHNVESIIDHLKEGIELIPKCERVIYAYKLTSDGYEGVLCEKKMLKILDGKVYLDNEVNSLVGYYFNKEDIFKTKTQEFYRFLRLDDYDKVVLTKSPIEIVKSIILKRASWSVAKQYNMTKNDWKSFKNFIDTIVDDTFFQEICNECDCEEDEARRYFKNFLESADDILDSNDMDIAVLTKVVEHSDKLKAECEAIVEKKWKDSHKNEIKTAEAELNDINKEIAKNNNRLESLKKEIKEKKSLIEKLEQDTKYFEEIGRQTVDNINKKLENAKNDVADFVSEVSFVSTAINGTSAKNINANNFISGIEYDDTDIAHSYKDSIDYISDELAEAGVESYYRDPFACFLYAAYINKEHLLFAGPNGESIANAFSVALLGKSAGVLDCDYKYDQSIVNNMLSSDDQIIIIKNPFSNGWIYKLLDEGRLSNKLFIYVTPFSEDLVIEPKGLYNYFIPVFTEGFINDVPTNDFVGSKMSDDYEEYERKNVKSFYNDYFKAINVNGYLLSKIQRLLNDMHCLYKETDNTVDYLFIHFGYAYVTGKKELLIDRIKNESSIDKEKRYFMLKYLGDNDE